jgi:hypothetical protein
LIMAIKIAIMVKNITKQGDDDYNAKAIFYS